MSILLDPAIPITGDTLRIVTLSDGGRPIEVLNLNDGTGYFRQRDADFTFTPAASNVQYSNTARRYGGARAVGQTHENGTIAWTCYIKGSSDSDIRTRIENLLAQIAEVARGRYIEWAPGSGRSSFFELAGPGDWQPAYQVRQFIEGFTVSVQLTFPVLPLVRWAPMTITDPFDVDSSSDYTFDALASTNAPITGGVMTASGSLTTERRARHTSRGYQTLGGQRTQKFTPLTTITNFKGGVTLRASAADTYVEVYVDDNGTNSRLRIDIVIAGVRTNRQTTNLAARITTGTAFWVRGRIEGNVVTAEYFTTTPTPIGTPTLTAAGYTLTGGEQTSLVAGYTGFTWIPQNAGATMDDFAFDPYVRRNVTLPARIAFSDAIPGTAPALAAVSMTSTNAIAWALVAWDADRPAGPIGILDSSTATLVFSTGFTTNTTATSYGGSDLRTTTGLSGLFASWPLQIADVTGDDFTDDTVALEIWARVIVSSTTVTPHVIASVTAFDALTDPNIANPGEKFTQEFGIVGRSPAKPSSGTVYRMTRLGTIRTDANDPALNGGRVAVRLTSGVASTGGFGLDYLIVVASSRRTVGPTGLAHDGTYPDFIPAEFAGVETTKTISSDLAGRLALASQPGATATHHGLNGTLIQPAPGSKVLLVKLSELVPDDPTANTATETLARNASLTLDVTPRSFLLRS